MTVPKYDMRKTISEIGSPADPNETRAFLLKLAFLAALAVPYVLFKDELPSKEAVPNKSATPMAGPALDSSTVPAPKR